MYLTLARPLALVGAESVLYDQRGHGLSERPPTGYSLADSVADLAELLDALGLSEEPVFLVGNSYGGAVAVAFALAHPARVAGLALLEAHVPGPGWGERMAASMTGLRSDVHVAPLLDEVAGYAPALDERFTLRAREFVRDTSVAADLLATPPVPDEALGALCCPVLAVYGERSDITATAHRLAAALTDCTLELLPDTGHFLLATAAPKVARLLADWLSQHIPAPGSGRPPVLPA
jgi:pimeloyl-ACP methyl ester carboxylesterase